MRHRLAGALAEGGPAICPLPRLDGLEPQITATGPGSVEISYPGRACVPSFVPVFAAMDGMVCRADRLPNGAMVHLDHIGGWATQYAGLQHLLTKPGHGSRKVRVQAGDVLGHARRSDLRIRFSVFRLTDDEWIAIDPVEQLRTWSLLPWFTEPTMRASKELAPRGDPVDFVAESIGASLDRTIQPKFPTPVRS